MNTQKLPFISWGATSTVNNNNSIPGNTVNHSANNAQQQMNCHQKNNPEELVPVEPARALTAQEVRARSGPADAAPRHLDSALEAIVGPVGGTVPDHAMLCLGALSSLASASKVAPATCLVVLSRSRSWRLFSCRLSRRPSAAISAACRC